MDSIDIKKLRETLGLTQASFAKKLGVSTQTISNWENGGTIPQSKYDAIKALKDKDEKNEKAVTGPSKRKEDEETDVDRIPLLPVEAIAGRAIGYSRGVTLADCRFIDNPIPGADVAIQVSGDSMLPEITSGTILYIKKILSKTFIPWGHTVVLDTQDGSLVKRIYPAEDSDEYIIAKSTNPEYPPYKVATEDIIGIYRILGTTTINSTL